MRFVFGILAIFLMLLPHSVSAAFEKKVALVVGNAAYKNTVPLTNSVKDAEAIAASFRRLGFEVITGFDLDLPGMNDAVRRFRLEARDADLSAFFYAGHALQAEGQNFIVPVDARFEDDAALDFEAMKMDFVMRQMRNTEGVALVFLDACRDNPLARSLGPKTRSTVGRGLAPIELTDAGKGLAIAFATSPGEVAYDGTGINSPFTTALLKHIETEGSDITEVMARVTGEVLTSTGQGQRPWLNASLTGPVVLKPVQAVAAPAAAAPLVQQAALSTPAGLPAPELQTPSAPRAAVPGPSVSEQVALFEFAQKANTEAHYRVYMNTYPNGLFVELARQAIEKLRAAPASPAPVQVAALPATTANSGAGAAPAAVAPGVAAVAPPAFVITDEMRAVLGTPETEKALGLNRNARRAVQHRLNLSDFNVGGADGSLGPRSRRGITAWQTAHGFQPTGFLTAPQLAALETQTETAYAAAEAERRAAAARRASAKKKAASNSSKRVRSKKKRTAKRRTTTRTVRRRTNNSGNNAAAAAFMGGIIGGAIGGAIGR